MTALTEGDGRGCRASADESTAVNEDLDQTETPARTAPSVTRVPLHGPVDTYDVMCAKVMFALCGSVFPHPLLLAQQLLGIEDQDFPEFQLNVAEAGNNCIDIVAAYLTNLRVMQQEEDPNPPVSLAMIQPRHAVTVASVAAKARELISELALARATVKPRKAPKNKAIESAARAAAAAAAAATSSPSSATSALLSAAGTTSCAVSGSALPGSGLDNGSSLGEVVSGLSETPSDCAITLGEDAFCSESTDESSCGWAGAAIGAAGALPGHQDTSRQGDCDAPRTVREEEERLLVALQGPAAAEETLKVVRAKMDPAGCKAAWSGASPVAEGRAAAAATPASGAQTNGAPHNQPAPSNSGSHPNGQGKNNTAATGGANVAGPATAPATATAASSPRAPSGPPPPPARSPSSLGQMPAGNLRGSSPTTTSTGYTNGNTGQRLSQELGRSGGAGRGGGSIGHASPSLQTALSCPVTGLPTDVVQPAPSTSPPASTSAQHIHHHHHNGHGGGGGGHFSSHHNTHHNHAGQGSASHRRNGGGQQQQQQHQATNGGGGAPAGGGRRNNAGGGGSSSRASPTAPPSALQQQLQEQQQHQQLALAHLLGLRTPYGNNAYGNLVALQGAAAYAANAAAGLSSFGAAPSPAPGRLDSLNSLNSVAATTAALELAAAQQVALTGMAHLNMNSPMGFGAAAAGFGGQAMQAAGLSQLAGQLGGLGPAAAAALVQHQHQQQQQQQQQAAAAAAAAALLQGGGGMLLADSIKGAGAAGATADWSNVLLQAQLAAGSLS